MTAFVYICTFLIFYCLNSFSESLCLLVTDTDQTSWSLCLDVSNRGISNVSDSNIFFVFI